MFNLPISFTPGSLEFQREFRYYLKKESTKLQKENSWHLDREQLSLIFNFYSSRIVTEQRYKSLLTLN